MTSAEYFGYDQDEKARWHSTAEGRAGTRTVNCTDQLKPFIVGIPGLLAERNYMQIVGMVLLNITFF